MNLSINFAGIQMKNPVTTASGTFGDGVPFKDFFDVSELGALIVKGTSLEPWKGNPPHRVVETPCGMLNSIGLQNVGVKAFIKEKLSQLKEFNLPIIVGVFDRTADNYARVVECLHKEDGIAGIEANLSCPNIEKGGKTFCDFPESVFEVLQKVRKVTDKPLIAKLSPNTTDIVTVAKAAKEGGADALSMINTVVGMRIDIEKQKPYLSTNTGGLSGPAIHPIAVAKVFLTAQANLGLPILGIGGITNANDAIEFLLAGASAVAVGTANFVNPRAAIEVLEGIKRYMEERKIEDVGEIVGKVIDKIL